MVPRICPTALRMTRSPPLDAKSAFWSALDVDHAVRLQDERGRRLDGDAHPGAIELHLVAALLVLDEDGLLPLAVVEREEEAVRLEGAHLRRLFLR
jgi:hypothetical protein